MNYALNINEVLKEFVNESNAKQVLKLIANTFTKGNYLVIGGFALRIYDKNARPLTPDIDILLSMKAGGELDKFLKKASLVDKHYIHDAEWIITKADNVEVDIKIESTDYEREALKNSNIVEYEDITLAVIKPEYLALMKLDSLREKDEQDLITISAWENFDFSTFEKLVRKYLPDKVEDFKQLKTIVLWKIRGDF